MPGQIQWLNHAGFAVRSEAGTSLVVDPWLSGDVFNGSWRLLSPTRTAIGELADCRHIWISHEHPDHFSPAALRAFPEAQRAQITVWYQATRDGRVARFCRSLGFQVREVTLDDELAMGPGLVGRCGTTGFDSWLHLQVDGTSVLNMNDCDPPSAGEVEAIAAAVGPVEVLLQQFSYANGMTNPEDREVRREWAYGKLANLTRSIELFGPRHVIPCASFVWFCHQENAYLNDEVVSIERAADHVDALGRIPVVLHPGDRWTLGAPHDNATALARYAEDVRQAAAAPLVEAAGATDAELLAASDAAVRRSRAKNQLWALAPLRRTRYLREVIIEVDGSPTRQFRYDMFHGLHRRSPGPAGDPDVEMSAESLLFCLTHEYGMNTLLVNGRFRERRAGGLLRLRIQFSPMMRNNHGESFPGVFLSRRFLTTEARKLVTIRRRALAR